MTVNVNKTVLIVEDEESLRVAIKDKLDREGYRTLIAADGIEALAIVQQQKVNLILLDIVMPNMDGMNFNAKLKELSLDAVPVIVLTNLNPVSTQESVKEILIKSEVSLEQIVQAVSRHIT